MPDPQWQVDSVTPTPPPAPPQGNGQWQVDSVTPTAPPPPPPSGIDRALEMAKAMIPGTVVGGAEGAARTLAGLVDMANKPIVPSLAKDPNAPLIPQVKRATDWVRAHTQPTTIGQEAGNVGESIGEVAIPGGAAARAAEAAPGLAEAAEAAPKLSEHFAGLSKFLKVMEDYPAIRAMVKTATGAVAGGTRTAAEAGGQTYLKTGGDIDATEKAAVTGGALGGGLQGATTLAGETAAALRPTTEALEDETIPVLANQRPNAPLVSKLMSRASDLPDVDAAQQAAPDKVIQTGAQRALKNVIDKVNETRQIQGPPDPSGIQPGQFKFSVDNFDPRMETEPLEGGNVAEQQRQMGTTATTVPERLTGGPVSDAQMRQQGMGPLGSTVPSRLLTGEGAAPPPYVTTDPMEAQKLLTEAQRISENPMIGPRLKARVDARIQSLSDQLDQYSDAQATVPNFKPIDPTQAMKGVHDFRTAGDLMQRSVSDVYKRMNAATDGEMSTLIQQPRYKAAARMNELFDEHSSEFTKPEWEATTEAYRKGFVAKELDNAVQGAFNITKQTAADTADIGGVRRFSGSEATGNAIDKVIADHGDDVKDMIGNQGIRSLRRMNMLLKDPETSGPLMKILDKTASVLRRHGGPIGGVLGGYAAPMLGLSHATGSLGGVAAGEAATKVVNYMATDPQIADRIAYATANRILPSIAGPLAASMVIRKDQPQEPQ
jgi:hypothetical protein